MFPDREGDHSEVENMTLTEKEEESTFFRDDDVAKGVEDCNAVIGLLYA